MAQEQHQQENEVQQHPPTEQQSSPPAPQNVNLKKASAKQDLAFLTSGAKEKRDKTVAGMKGAAHIMTHPFNKQAKEEATAKTIQEKNEIGDKQERIRATAHIQMLQEKAIADGEDPRSVPGLVYPPPPPPGAELPQNGAAENGTEPSAAGPENESEISAGEDKLSEESSDGSSRGRARALSQIPPDSKDYQSG